MYDYRVTPLSFHDGDTIRVDIDFGFDVRQRRNIRLRGINAPKLSTPKGKLSAGFAAAWVQTHTSLDGYIGLKTFKDKAEKYGRLLGEVYDMAHPDDTLNAAMLATGHALPYDGRGPKPE